MSDNSELQKKEVAHDVAIALMSKDITYIRDSIRNLETTLALYDRNFAKKDEVQRLENLISSLEKVLEKNHHEMQKSMTSTINKLDEDVKRALDKKVENKDFDPIKKTLSRINWIMISGVVLALLSLIIQTGK